MNETTFGASFQQTLYSYKDNEKKDPETHTLRAGCSRQPKNFAPPQTPSRGRMMAKI